MMTSNGWWTLFIETGGPVFYLLYRETLETEPDEKTA